MHLCQMLSPPSTLSATLPGRFYRRWGNRFREEKSLF